MKIREQITQFESKRAASDARMTALMEASGTDESGWEKDRRVDIMLGT